MLRSTRTRVTLSGMLWNRSSASGARWGAAQMATIIQLRGSERFTGADTRTPTGLVGALLVALAAVLGATMIGVAIAVVFCGGMVLADLERRTLRPGEFAAIAGLHAVAVVLLAF